ncbi:hypothetical protein E2C01_063393 [Portunus trituberculatus]|uniref:Uncharacterized protein n=1 Tax=Portunus trituberculatus TaxID=210409 RepID=A0A5B7HKB8_PORTR|nr:hypothetical protein [Portunus trituberculatus]
MISKEVVEKVDLFVFLYFSLSVVIKVDSCNVFRKKQDILGIVASHTHFTSSMLQPSLNPQLWPHTSREAIVQPSPSSTTWLLDAPQGHQRLALMQPRSVPPATTRYCQLGGTLCGLSFN